LGPPSRPEQNVSDCFHRINVKMLSIGSKLIRDNSDRIVRIRDIIEAEPNGSALLTSITMSNFVFRGSNPAAGIEFLLQARCAGESDPRVVSAIARIREHFGEPGLTLCKLSRDLHVSRQRLGSLFTTDTGISVGHFIRLVRMAESARILRETALLVKQTAIQVGYPNTANFDRDFRETFGVCPTRYRGAIRKPGTAVQAFGLRK
jgi:AraC-like DNA-binding protein